MEPRSNAPPAGTKANLHSIETIISPQKPWQIDDRLCLFFLTSPQTQKLLSKNPNRIWKYLTAPKQFGTGVQGFKTEEEFDKFCKDQAGSTPAKLCKVHTNKMNISQARVKSVLSGDTVVLTSLNNKNQERTLGLAFVIAPRLRKEGDEPFAFQSRDFLRRLLVGKVVQFQVNYTVPGAVIHEYGLIILQNGSMLPHQAVSEGWAKLRDDAGKRDDKEESKTTVETLQLEEAKAKAKSKGIWASEGGRINLQQDISDPKAFATEWKDKPVNATVERVLAGDRLIVRLLVEPTKHIQTLVLIAGIRAPATKRTNVSDNKEVPGEPFGEDAKNFIEERLLQRSVTVNILGTSPQGQLICSVIHPLGSIAEFIVQDGLARCADNHSTLLGSEMAKLRIAEKDAKTAQKGLFQNHVPTKSSASDVEVTVSRIQTSDTIFVRNRAGAEKKIGLSSIRQPKPSDPKQAPFQAEAKEYLRKRLIGKHVKLTVDGKKPAQDNYEEREVGTVVQNGKNVALGLVESGYASVIRHRRDDDDRSPYYDDLLAAEEIAMKEQKGMWSPKPPTTKTIVDYSESLQKAKVQASVLQRQKKIPAVVDYVKSGSRFTVLIPRENGKLTFVLSCIRAPRSARGTEASEPFGQEAHDFANRRCLQRDVEIDVEGTDKVGGFIGTLYVNRENFAKLLLEEGFATVHTYSAEQHSSGAELIAAEKHAKDARKGVWKDHDPSADDDSAPTNGTSNLTPATTDTNGSTSKRELDYRNVTVTHIDPATLRLKLQIISPSTSDALEGLMAKFRTHHSSHQPTLPTPPKAGDYVSAKFSADGSWYRARIRRNDRDAKAAEVVYIDYGNEEKLPWASLRALPAQFAVQTLKPQAVDAVLAFLQWPTAKEYLEDAAGYLQQVTDGQELAASVDFIDTKDNGTLVVTLFAQGSEERSVNADVVGEGLAVVKRKLGGWERTFEGKRGVVEGLKRKEEEARERRRGMWEFGEVVDDE